jgi:GAF domain-containing protein
MRRAVGLWTWYVEESIDDTSLQRGSPYIRITRSGALVGMLSTHYRTPRRPEDRDLWLLDLLARQAADAIERTQIEEARLQTLTAVDRLKDQFVAMLAHELRILSPP